MPTGDKQLKLMSKWGKSRQKNINVATKRDEMDK